MPCCKRLLAQSTKQLDQRCREIYLGDSNRFCSAKIMAREIKQMEFCQTDLTSLSCKRTDEMRKRRTGDRTVQVGPTCTAGEMEKSQKDSKTQIGLINDTFVKLYICPYTV